MRRVAGGLAALAMLAGCGSGTVDEANRYVDAVNRAQTRFSGTMDRLSGRISAGSTLGADGRVLRSFDTAVARVAGDLRRITPPDSVAGLHRRLVGDMDQYGVQVRRERGTLRSRDPRRLVAAQQRLLSATTSVSRDLNATIDEINQRLKK